MLHGQGNSNKVNILLVLSCLKIYKNTLYRIGMKQIATCSRFS